MTTFDAIQFSEYMEERPRLLHYVWEASLKFTLVDSDASVLTLCCCLNRSKLKPRDKWKVKVGTKRDLVFLLFLYCGYYIYLGFLNIRACVTMFT